MFDRENIIKRGHHWFGKRPLPERYFGFLYAIINVKNKKLYIGKKHYKGRRNRKNNTYYEVNNKWEFYTSSSKYVNEDIEKIGIEYFVFIILKNYEGDIKLAKAEEDLQKELKVLNCKIGDDFLFYNRSINGKLFRSTEKDKSKKIQPLTNYLGKNNPNFGKKHTEEARKIMSEASKNRKTNPESYKKSFITKIKNRKVYKFTHKEGHIFIGTKEDIVESYENIKIGGIKDLIAGKTHDKTCMSGYSRVHSRYGWISAEFLGLAKDIDNLKRQYGTKES